MNQNEQLPDGLNEVSDEHYEIILFGKKMAQGLRDGIETKRLKAYADWFFKNYLLPHINLEEEHVFPILGDNVRVKRALANHRRLLRLFNDEEDVYISMNRIEEEIGRFIRFEERVLLPQIIEKATEADLVEIKKHQESLKNWSEKDYKDKFWKKE